MIYCEHFIYTTGQSELKTGYQIIAKSNGITEEITNHLRDYLYPIGVNPSEFTESKSLLVIRNDKIAYSRVKNIGVGYDGRDNTLYNHTIIMNIDDFKKIDNNSKKFDSFFIEDPFRKNKELPLISMDLIKNDVDLSTVHEINTNTLESILVNIFRTKKIVILGKSMNLIQDILLLVPPSLRLTSFSTLVNDPNKQPRYSIIQTTKQYKTLIPDSFTIIDPQGFTSTKNTKKDLLEQNINYLINVLYSNNVQLSTIHSNFEDLSGTNAENKINLILSYEQFRLSKNKIEKEKFAIEVLDLIEKADHETGLIFLNKIKEVAGEEDVKDHYAKLKTIQIASSEFAITLKSIEELLNKIRYAGTDIQIKLLKNLSEQRKVEFLESGSELIVDAFSSHSWYRDEIIRCFIEQEFLQKCIFDIFDKENKTSNSRKQDLYQHVLEIAEIHYHRIIPDLLRHKPFDTTSRNESQQFKKLVRNMLWILMHRQINNDILFKIIKFLKRDIKNTLENSRGKNLEINRNLLEIVTVLIEATTHIRNNAHEPKLLDEVFDMEKSLKKIREKLKPSESRSRLSSYWS